MTGDVELIASLLSLVIQGNNAVSYEYDRNIMVCKFISEYFCDPLRWQLSLVSIHITLSTTVTVSGLICFPKKNKSFRQEYQASGKGATYCMKTSGEDKFTDLEELNILIIGETGFPHPVIFTNQG